MSKKIVAILIGAVVLFATAACGSEKKETVVVKEAPPVVIRSWERPAATTTTTVPAIDYKACILQYETFADKLEDLAIETASTSGYVGNPAAQQAYKARARSIIAEGREMTAHCGVPLPSLDRVERAINSL